MPRKPPPRTEAAPSRQARAAKKQAAGAPPEPLAPHDVDHLLRELEAHQLELERQNEALRRAQEALAASQARYFDLYEQAPVGYVDIDEQGLVLEANAAAARLLGVAKKTLAGRPLARYVAPPDLALYESHRRALFESGEAQMCDLRMRRGRSGQFWARLHASLALDRASGKPRCRAVLGDIGERKAAEAAAARSEARMRAIVDTASSAIVTINAQGAIQTFNAAAERLFGYAAAEVCGRDVSLLMPPPHRERHADYIAAYLRTGRPKVIGAGREVAGLRRDGTEFPLSISVGEFREGGERFFTAILQDIGERVRAEAALREQQATLQSFYDSSPFMMGVAELDGEEGVQLSSNAAHARFLGMDPKDVQNAPGRALTRTPELYRLWQENYRLSQREGRPVRFEFEFPGPGGPRWVAATVGHLGEGRGGRPRFSFIAEDATERKKADEERARLQLLIEHSSDLIAMADLDGNITYMNSAGRRMTGLPEAGALAPLNIADYTAPESLELHRAAALPALRETGRWEGELRVRNLQTGALTDVSRSIFLMRDGAGQPFGFGVVSRDITRRKRAEAALRESQEQLDAMLRQTSAGLAKAGLDGRLLFVNDKFCEIAGRTREELLALGYQSITDPADLPGNEALFERCAREGRDFVLDKRYLRPDNSPVWVRIHVSPVRGADGRIDSVMAATFDISGIKQAEAALRESEAFAHAVLNAVSAEIAVLDPAGDIVAVNEPWRRFAAENREGPGLSDIGANYLEACRADVGEESAQAARDGILAVLRGAAPSFSQEYPCHAPREARWFHMTVTPLGEARGGAVVSHIDITARKRAEESLALQKHLLEMVVAGAPLPQTLDALLRRIEGQEPGMASSILLLDEDGAHLRHAAAPSLPASYTRAVDGMAVGEGQGSCGTAAARRAPVVVEDIAADPLWAGFKHLAAAAGLRACWAHPIFDAAGDVLGTFAIYYPFPARPTPRHLELVGLVVHIAALAITRRREEQALKKSEERLAYAMDASGEGVWDWDIEGGRVVHNRKCFELLGLPSGLPERSPKFFTTLLHPDDRPDVLARVREALAGDGKYRSEHRIRRADGEYIWVQEHGSVVKRGAAGRPSRMVGSFADISERKKAERALKDSEERLSLVMEAAEIGTWDWDLRSGRLLWSPRCLALYGLPPDTAMTYGRFLQALHPEDRERVDRAMRGALELHQDYQMEMRTVWPDGSLHWVASRGRAHYDAEGRPTRMSGAALDLTEHKRVAQQLRERQLEAERYIRLHVANQTIAAIAHELNQPLNAIASYSAGALRLLEAPDPPREKLAQAFQQNARQALRAGQVIRELLAFLRGNETVTEPLDLNSVVRETLDNLKSDALFDGVKTRLALAEPLPPVQANRVQVEKVLANLLRNGVEAMQAAGLPAKAVWIEARTAANGRLAQVTVRDSGPGLEGEAARRVFEPFFSTKPGGLGMGLAISRALIEAHGGELWAEQEPGAGASFHFTLPFA